MQTNRFEHPLNEKVRIYLRLEYLIRQMTHASQLSDQWQHQIFFRALFDLLEILDQIQVKSELAKDLDKQRTKLKSWLNIEGVDQSALLSILDNMDLAHHQLITANRLGQEIREDRFLSGIKQRFSIPGGSCCFDLPTLHHWLHLPLAHKQNDMANWLKQLAELTEALNLWLRFTRESGQYQPQIARCGFFQHDAEDACLLRLEICPTHGVYPMISGHRSRFAIRFLPFEEGASIADAIEFKLAIC
ncbi:cell division protein ZapD [Photobacterium sp. SDRW27]|uniref:cell division protein ZapD n=1 Tax=Photobacterium obscurum TaxID=2829490 RepID=UPI0022442A59|nr:cell division protein ZapD [Photobacterium obscurum]MCW8330495.1 cell division protein ZapD [Photobacterium obscurum]